MQSMTAAEGGMFQATKGSLMIVAMFNEKEKTASIGVSTQGKE